MADIDQSYLERRKIRPEDVVEIIYNFSRPELAYYKGTENGVLLIEISGEIHRRLSSDVKEIAKLYREEDFTWTSR